MAEYNAMQTVKRRFFAMRNGIVADTLRRTMPEYKMVFGLNIPQIADIARETGISRALAEELWADRRTRESMLMAPMIFPIEELDAPTAGRMMDEVVTPEVADILCHRLLRHHPDARRLAMERVASPDDLVRYTAFSLLFNLLPDRAEEVKPFAEAEFSSACPLTRALTRALLEEIDFLSEE
ncbi:MAG: DNA alkylation repair protein [Duncaniella sp.]|nr:DNA alkylation repair protein [Duncaniella sp.]